MAPHTAGADAHFMSQQQHEEALFKAVSDGPPPLPDLPEGPTAATHGGIVRASTGSRRAGTSVASGGAGSGQEVLHRRTSHGTAQVGCSWWQLAAVCVRITLKTAHYRRVSRSFGSPDPATLEAHNMDFTVDLTRILLLQQ